MLAINREKLANRRALFAAQKDRIKNWITHNITTHNVLIPEQITQIANQFQMKEDGLLILLKDDYTIKKPENKPLLISVRSQKISQQIADYAKEHYSKVGVLELFELGKLFNRSERSVIRYLKAHKIKVHRGENRSLCSKLNRKQNLYLIHQFIKKHKLTNTKENTSPVKIASLSACFSWPYRTFRDYYLTVLRMSAKERKAIQPITDLEQEYLNRSFYVKMLCRTQQEKQNNNEILKLRLRKIIGIRDPLIPVPERLRWAKRLKITETKINMLLLKIRAENLDK